MRTFLSSDVTDAKEMHGLPAEITLIEKSLAVRRPHSRWSASSKICRTSCSSACSSTSILEICIEVSGSWMAGWMIFFNRWRIFRWESIRMISRWCISSLRVSFDWKWTPGTKSIFVDSFIYVRWFYVEPLAFKLRKSDRISYLIWLIFRFRWPSISGRPLNWLKKCFPTGSLRYAMLILAEWTFPTRTPGRCLRIFVPCLCVRVRRSLSHWLWLRVHIYVIYMCKSLAIGIASLFRLFGSIINWDVSPSLIPTAHWRSMRSISCSRTYPISVVFIWHSPRSPLFSWLTVSQTDYRIYSDSIFSSVNRPTRLTWMNRSMPFVSYILVSNDCNRWRRQTAFNISLIVLDPLMLLFSIFWAINERNFFSVARAWISVSITDILPVLHHISYY